MSSRHAQAAPTSLLWRLIDSLSAGAVRAARSTSAPIHPPFPNDDLPADLRWPPYDHAIRHGNASFAAVAQAYFDFPNGPDACEDTKRKGQYYFPRLLETFYLQHGHIDHLILCNETQAAAAITDRDEFWFKLPRENHDHHEFCKMMMRCYMTYVEARQILDRNRGERRICVNLLFTVFGYLVNAVDLEEKTAKAGRAKVERTRAGLLEVAEDMLAHVETYYRRTAQQVAKRWYFLGVLLGAWLASLVAVFLVIGWNKDWTPLPHTMPAHEFGAILASIVAGGIGAAISVMSRTTSGKLVLDHRAPRWLLVKLGAFRIVIGSTFAVALFLLVMGGLMHMSSPDPDQSVGQWLYFFTGIAFVAGFSERLAQDMLAIPEQRLAGTSPDRDPVPPRPPSTRRRS